MDALTFALARRPKFGLHISSIMPPDDRAYPSLLAVQQLNNRDVSSNNPQPPQATDWLYGDPSTNAIYLAKGRPDNLIRYATWNSALVPGGRVLSAYRFHITPHGDIICVWNGAANDLSYIPRSPAIVYPHDDLSNPVVVDLGELNPTAWIESSGADYVYARDYFMFAEYTRAPQHTHAHIWKVVPPFTNPANWTIVYTRELSGDPNIGVKHFHTIQYDPFSGVVLTSVGDDDSAAEILVSDDDGATWQSVLKAGQGWSRVTNFVFTPDAVYWPSDTPYPHQLNRAARFQDGSIDWGNATKLTDLRAGQSSYKTVLLHDPPGLLFLDHYDGFPQGTVTGALEIFFWNFEDSRLYKVADIYPVDGFDSTRGEWGFRGCAGTFHQSLSDRRIVVGFDQRSYDAFRATLKMRVLTNRFYLPLGEQRIGNLALEVYRVR